MIGEEGDVGEARFSSSTSTSRLRNIGSINSTSEENLLPAEKHISSLSTSQQNVATTTTEALKHGTLNVLSEKYESLNYDTCENYMMLDEEKQNGFSTIGHHNLMKWFIFLMIGMFTALVACFINISIEEVSKIKYAALANSVDTYVTQGKLFIPYLQWALYNLIPVLIGSLLVAFVEPVAAGSGIPQVKCYLNGVQIPRIVRVKTLIVKSIGVICSVVGGLAGGKEGPMIHSGAVVAAGLSQGKSTSFKIDLGIFKKFREDHEKRDFVSGGAAAGVAAAFGAPVGGVLFSLEEGASFWNQALTWKTFFCSVVSMFTLNVVLSTYHGVPGQLTYPGLLNLGKFESFHYEMYELPVFVLMGCLGGLLGAFWNHLNYKLAVFRVRYVKKPLLRVMEACLVAVMSATVGFVMMYLLNDCKPLGEDPTKYPVQLYCKDGQYNAVTALWFQTPEASVRSLFHDPVGSHKATSLLIFVVFYFLLSCWTFGLACSSGLFIPTLLLGAAWGRFIGAGFQHILGDAVIIQPGKFALIGAAAQLGGVVRMTISLTVIIMETTGNITFALPLIVTLIAAKWTGDFFNEGIYDIHIQLGGVPLLPWEPPPLTHNIYASEVMSHPAVVFRTTENVGFVMEMLKSTTHSGFPIVDPPVTGQREIRTYRKIRGLILRSQLIVILKQKLFNELSDKWVATAELFRDEYPRFPTINEIKLEHHERQFTIDMRPFMNPSPYTVLHSTSLPRMFRLFRALGLRHLPIVNDSNEVVGMVTRKDLARYRVWHHQGRMGVEELYISKYN